MEDEGLVEHDIVGRMKLYRLTKVGEFEADEKLQMKGKAYKSVEPRNVEVDMPMHINAFTSFAAPPREEERERRTHVASVPVPTAGPLRDVIDEAFYKMEKEDVLEEFEEIEYLVVVGPKRRR